LFLTYLLVNIANEAVTLFVKNIEYLTARK